MEFLPWTTPEAALPDFTVTAVAGMLVFIAVALQITQTKERVRWAGWLVPAVVAVPLSGWSVLALAREGPFGFIQSQIGSLWGMLIWYNLLASLGVAFFLLQNRARAAGMKSEIWVLFVAFTAGMGLLVMLARMLYLERQLAEPGSADPSAGAGMG